MHLSGARIARPWHHHLSSGLGRAESAFLHSTPFVGIYLRPIDLLSAPFIQDILGGMISGFILLP
jgi:hypothetical protein